MNTPYKRELHLAAIKATGAKLSQPNAFGDSPNNAHWAAFDVPGESRMAFHEVCEKFGLYTSWFGEANYAHSGEACMVIAKYERET